MPFTRVLCVAASVLLAAWLFVKAMPSGSVPRESAAIASAARLAAAPRYETASIENLSAGEIVLAADPVTGEQAEKRILRTFRNTAYKLRLLEFADRTGRPHRMETTDPHPFWLPDTGRFAAASELVVGNRIVGPSGEIQTLIGTESEAHPEGVPVFNFEVEDFHTYFVLPLGADTSPALVHNANASGDCGLLGLAAEGLAIRQSLRQVASVEDVHHIATHYGKWGKKFKSLFEPAGIDLHDAFNKVKIKGHSGGHGWYNEYVWERLSNAVADKSGAAAYRKALIDELMDLRWELRNTDLGDLIRATASPLKRLNGLQ